MNKTPNLLSLLTASILGALPACSTPSPPPEMEGMDSWSGDAIRNASLNNAIIRQHTLYPYHFAAGSAELNDLGERDLNVLSNYFTKSAHGAPRAMSGEVNVRRGDASEALYEARVKVVLDRLTAAGVEGGMVAVKDGLPGGEGMSSERVIVILKEKMSKQRSYGSSGSSSSGGTGMGNK
jgi:hypothetical protein